MKTFVKHYIGKGKQVEGLQIVKINLKINDLVNFAFKYKDEDFVSIEIAKLRTPDKYGHQYTVYVNNLEESQANEPVKIAATPKKKQRKSPKTTTSTVSPF